MEIQLEPDHARALTDYELFLETRAIEIEKSKSSKRRTVLPIAKRQHRVIQRYRQSLLDAGFKRTVKDGNGKEWPPLSLKSNFVAADDPRFPAFQSAFQRFVFEWRTMPLDSSAESHATPAAESPAVEPAPVAANGRIKKGNARSRTALCVDIILRTLVENYEAKGWSYQKWADSTGFSKSACADAWKKIKAQQA